MKRLVVVAALAATVIVSGCTSDGDKRPTDGGNDRDAGNVAPVGVDAGSVEAADAGVVEGVPLVEGTVDAGHMGDAKVTSDGKPIAPVVDGHAPVVDKDPQDGKEAATFSVFNRILAKAKTKDMTPQKVQDLAEEATGMKVEKVRRTAGTFWLIQFAPVTPVRQQADQAKLIDKLKASGAFAIVEGDQLMKLK